MHTGVKIGIGISASLLLAFAINATQQPQAKPADDTQFKREQEEINQKVTAAVAARTPPPLTTGWVYRENADSMGRGTIKRAQLESSNTVNFGFPYQGEQRAMLTLRKHPKYGKDVILDIERGQFMTGIDGCTVLVRFDDGKPRAFSASEPADNSTTTLFIRNYPSFVAAAKKSKRIQIEAPFFQEGDRMFEFNSEGLTWD